MNKTKLGLGLFSLTLLAIALMPLAPTSAGAIQGDGADAALGIFSDPMSFGLDCGGVMCRQGTCVDTNLSTTCSGLGGCNTIICSGEPGAPDQ